MKYSIVKKYLLISLTVFSLLFAGCAQEGILEPSGTGRENVSESGAPGDGEKKSVSISDLPEYDGEPYVEIDGNQPGFTKKEKTKKSFERYSELDSLGRCGTAYANIGQDLMPTGKRESISRVKPAGWHAVKYSSVDGKYLYNRCHLIGYQLTAENANEKNLITGTRYMNVEGMLPFENMVADFVEETDYHVLYRVTPIYEGDDLLAKGVQMEAYSVEDEGDGICFNVFVYNVQPEIMIDYATGDSRKDTRNVEKNKDAKDGGVSGQNKGAGKETAEPDVGTKAEKVEIRGNKKSKIYHCPGQAAYEEMADSHNLVVFRSEQEAVDAGYRKAKR